MSKSTPEDELKKRLLLLKDLVVCIKGAGEMATGIACRLFAANIKQIFMVETAAPKAVRRTVSFCEAVYDGSIAVEGVTARKAAGADGITDIWQDNEIAVVVDPSWDLVKTVKPHVVVDAIIAKKNLGTAMDEAPLTIGLGPGFTAGIDVDLVIETNRGHNLGRVIKQGPAEPNTGIPGVICGVSKERVLRAPGDGVFHSELSIGSLVKKDSLVGHVDTLHVHAAIDGMVRGLIRNGSDVTKGLKIGDVDPRGEKASYTTISEKGRAVGGAVLEAVMSKFNK